MVRVAQPHQCPENQEVFTSPAQVLCLPQAGQGGARLQLPLKAGGWAEKPRGLGTSQARKDIRNQGG